MVTTSKARGRQGGFAHRLLLFGLIAGVCIFAFLRVSVGAAPAATTIVKSGIHGYCLDDSNNGTAAGNQVDLSSCDESAAQNWVITGDHVQHAAACLSVKADGHTANTRVVTDPCADSPGQLWLQDGTGLYNPNSGMCLTAPGTDQQLVVQQCNDRAKPNQTWAATAVNAKQNITPAPCRGTTRALIVCYAEKEWEVWQAGTISHGDLLNKYTDGAAYEAWCADFVSYIYKEAGRPFTQAYDGWDENDANSIQNYGFILHQASSGYLPQPGDIAYFDYTGGHVEIVVGGGKTPTFIYGNSANIDSTTGNGQMEANTILDDGSAGQVVYYLSPN